MNMRKHICGDFRVITLRIAKFRFFLCMCGSRAVMRNIIMSKKPDKESNGSNVNLHSNLSLKYLERSASQHTVKLLQKITLRAKTHKPHVNRFASKFCRC